MSTIGKSNFSCHCSCKLVLYNLFANLEYFRQLILNTLQARKQRMSTQHLHKDAANTPTTRTNKTHMKLKAVTFQGRDLTTCPTRWSSCLSPAVHLVVYTYQWTHHASRIADNGYDWHCKCVTIS